MSDPEARAAAPLSVIQLSGPPADAQTLKEVEEVAKRRMADDWGTMPAEQAGTLFTPRLFDYTVLTATSADGLTRKVLEFLASHKGWDTLGGVSICWASGPTPGLVLAQAMGLYGVDD